MCHKTYSERQMEKKNKKKGKTRVSKVEKKRWKHDQWEIQFTFIYRIKQTVPAFGWLWTFRVKSRFHSTSSMANNAPIWCSTEHFQPQTCYIWYHMISTHTIGTSKCTISYYLFRGAIETHRVATTAPFGCLPTVKSSRLSCADSCAWKKPPIQPWQGLDPIHWSIRRRPREHLDEFLDAVVPRPNLPCTCDRDIDISWLHTYFSYDWESDIIPSGHPCVSTCCSCKLLVHNHGKDTPKTHSFIFGGWQSLRNAWKRTWT